MKTIVITDDTFETLIEIHNYYVKRMDFSSSSLEDQPLSAIRFMMGALSAYDKGINRIIHPEIYCKNVRWRAGARGIGEFYCSLGNAVSLEWCTMKKGICQYKEAES